MPVFTDLEYEIGSEAVILPYTDFYSARADTVCLYEWSYSLRLASIPFGGAGMEQYVTIDTASQEIVVYSDHNGLE